LGSVIFLPIQLIVVFFCGHFFQRSRVAKQKKRGKKVYFDLVVYFFAPSLVTDDVANRGRHTGVQNEC